MYDVFGVWFIIFNMTLFGSTRPKLKKILVFIKPILNTHLINGLLTQKVKKIYKRHLIQIK